MTLTDFQMVAVDRPLRKRVWLLHSNPPYSYKSQDDDELKRAIYRVAPKNRSIYRVIDKNEAI